MYEVAQTIQCSALLRQQSKHSASNVESESQDVVEVEFVTGHRMIPGQLTVPDASSR
jgi:hypothetical protein